MKKSMVYRALVMVITAVMFASCEPPVTMNSAVTVTNYSTSGDLVLSGQMSVQNGKIALTIGAIGDPNNPELPLSTSKVSFEAEAQQNKESGVFQPRPVEFSVEPMSKDKSTPVDIVFINDTTGSMAGTTTGIADSIQAFSTAITSEGVDARFAMYTYGDAFATKKETDSEFTIGKGDFPVPSYLDGVERPYIGLSSVSSFLPFLEELKASYALGSGGGDGPENTVGTLDYAWKKVAFRDGSAKVFVVIGDNPSHQASTTTYWDEADFKPRSGDQVVATLKGQATVYAICEKSSSTTYYPLKKLATGTGGAVIDLPYNGIVDLTSLGIVTWITSGYASECPPLKPGDYTFTITATYASAGLTYTGTLTITAVFE